MERGPGSREVPRLVLLAGLLSLWWDFGNTHAFHNSDTLVPVLMSLWKWTPFFWGEDRFGMPIALLAVPFRNPLANLLVQTWIAAFLGLLGLLLLPYCVLPRGSALAAGAVNAALFVALAPYPVLGNWLGTGQCYGTAMGLGAAGLALAGAGERPAGPVRMSASCVLLLASLWVNIAMATVLLPLALWRWTTAGGEAGGRGRAAIASLVIVAGAGLVMGVLMPSLRQHEYAMDAPGEWPGSWWRLAGDCWNSALAWKWAAGLFAAVAAGAAAAAVSLRNRATRPSPGFAASGAVLFAAGAAYLLGVGTIGWVASNGSFRYCIPSLALATAAAAVFGAGAVRAALPSRPGRLLPRLGLAALVLGLAFRAGPPFPLRVRTDIDRTLGESTGEILGLRCTHVIGTYSLVWPAVFHANLVLRERGESRRIWGISHRSGPTESLWKRGDVADWRIASFPGDLESIRYMYLNGLHDARIVKRSRTIFVLRCKP